jgi:uncharacterized membrane protein
VPRSAANKNGQKQPLFDLMPSRQARSSYRKAVVASSLIGLALVACLAFVILRQSDSSAQARLLADSSAPEGVSGALSVDPTAGGLRLCNKTASRVGVAIGYKLSEIWTTEGWWNVATGTCETLMAGPLVSRFYYIYAVDYDQGGVWGGKAIMCTRDKMFTIKGIEDCVARGFERTGFFEVDTGEQRSWTVQLTEPGTSGTGGQ